MSKTSPRRRNGGRKRKQPVTLPEVSPDKAPAAVEPVGADERVRASRESLARSADPLELMHGRRNRHKAVAYGDPTPERLKHARRAHVRLIDEVATTPQGHPTGDRRKRFVSILENRGVLDSADREAAERLQFLYVLSCGGSPAQFGYAERIPCGDNAQSRQEKTVEAQSQLAQVRGKLPQWALPVVDLIQRDAYEDVDLLELKKVYCPHLGNKRAKDKINDMLQFTCRLLCDIFEIRHAWSQ